MMRGFCQGRRAIKPTKVGLYLLMAVLLCAAAMQGCSGASNSHAGDVKYSLGNVSVSVPDSFALSTYEYDTSFGGVPAMTETIKIESPGTDIVTYVADLDAGVLNNLYEGSWKAYLESSRRSDACTVEDVTVGGRNGTLLVEGSPALGGELSGCVFVPYDSGRVVWISMAQSEGLQPGTAAISEFCASEQFKKILEGISITSG